MKTLVARIVLGLLAEARLVPAATGGRRHRSGPRGALLAALGDRVLRSAADGRRPPFRLRSVSRAFRRR